MGIQLPLTDLRLILRVLEAWLKGNPGYPCTDVGDVVVKLKAGIEAHDAKKAAREQLEREREAAGAAHLKRDARYDKLAEVSTLEQAARYEALGAEVKCVEDLPPEVRAALRRRHPAKP